MSDTKSTEFSNALADFSFNLYREIIKKNPDSNIFISPLSISYALAMTYSGAEGNTKNEMKKLLFGNWNENDEKFHSEYSRIMNLLNEQGKSFKLLLANRVYAHEPNLGDLLSDFKSVLNKNYNSELKPLDFGRDGGNHARGIINGWVQETTNDKIKDLIPEGALSELSRLVLVNAIYFKGDWQKKFEPAATRKKEFFVDENKKLELDMMAAHNQKFFYNEDDNFQILGMPYKGKELYFFAWLPKEKFGLKNLEANLNGRQLLESISSPENGMKLEFVLFPKFKLEESIGLVQILKNLGASDMFDESKADFSKINGKKNDLFVSDVVHKAFIEVNEEGTEAAAATGVVMNTRCAVLPGPSFIADHPFLFAIADVRSNTILFMGKFMGK